MCLASSLLTQEGVAGLCKGAGSALEPEIHAALSHAIKSFSALQQQQQQQQGQQGQQEDELQVGGASVVEQQQQQQQQQAAKFSGAVYAGVCALGGPPRDVLPRVCGELAIEAQSLNLGVVHAQGLAYMPPGELICLCV